MAVKRLGHDKWQSTRTGHVYTSEEAAQHYDGREALRDSLAADRAAEEAAAKLTPDELLGILRLAAHEGDAKQNQALAEGSVKDFLRVNPDYDDSGANGSLNAGAMKGSLTAQGLSAPYSFEDLQRTFEHLRDHGVLALKPGKPSTSEDFDEEVAYNMPMKDLVRRVRGF